MSFLNERIDTREGVSDGLIKVEFPISKDQYQEKVVT